jgi:hypothetical protein
MHLIKKIEQRSIARNALLLLAAITLSIAVATDGLAGGRGGGGGGGLRGGHIRGGFRGPLLNSVPSMPPPIFNPSSPYTVPPSPETPVSPASPGSVFH